MQVKQKLVPKIIALAKTYPGRKIQTAKRWQSAVYGGTSVVRTSDLQKKRCWPNHEMITSIFGWPFVF